MKRLSASDVTLDFTLRFTMGRLLLSLLIVPLSVTVAAASESQSLPGPEDGLPKAVAIQMQGTPVTDWLNKGHDGNAVTNRQALVTYTRQFVLESKLMDIALGKLLGARAEIHQVLGSAGMEKAGSLIESAQRALTVLEGRIKNNVTRPYGKEQSALTKNKIESALAEVQRYADKAVESSWKLTSLKNGLLSTVETALGNVPALMAQDLQMVVEIPKDVNMGGNGVVIGDRELLFTFQQFRQDLGMTSGPEQYSPDRPKPTRSLIETVEQVQKIDSALRNVNPIDPKSAISRARFPDPVEGIKFLLAVSEGMQNRSATFQTEDLLVSARAARALDRPRTGQRTDRFAELLRNVKKLNSAPSGGSASSRGPGAAPLVISALLLLPASTANAGQAVPDETAVKALDSGAALSGDSGAAGNGKSDNAWVRGAQSQQGQARGQRTRP